MLAIGRAVIRSLKRNRPDPGLLRQRSDPRGRPAATQDVGCHCWLELDAAASIARCSHL